LALQIDAGSSNTPPQADGAHSVDRPGTSTNGLSEQPQKSADLPANPRVGIVTLSDRSHLMCLRVRQSGSSSARVCTQWAATRPSTAAPPHARGAPRRDRRHRMPQRLGRRRDAGSLPGERRNDCRACHHSSLGSMRPAFRALSSERGVQRQSGICPNSDRQSS
jgi:hypothetical protein